MQDQPYTQSPIVYTPEQLEAVHRSNRTKLKWGIICLVAPTALIIIGFIGYAILNFVTGSAEPTSEDPYGPSSPIRTAMNIVLFVIGAVATLTWLPGIIGGIVLLATRKKI